MIVTVTLNAAIDKRYVVENFQVGTVNRVLECSYTAGGKGLNVARIIAQTKTPVVATGFIGGYAGKYIEQQLIKQNIENAFYHLTAESRSCVNIWDLTTKKQTEILEPGFNVSQEHLEALIKHYTTLIESTKVVTLSGSVPQGLSDDVYQEFVKLAKNAGKKVILDTSGQLLKAGIDAKPTMIKPNIDEIRMLTGKSCNNINEIIEAATSIYEKGVKIVVVSLGVQGAAMVCDEGIYKVIVPKIKTVNTVGCGDALVGGFALGLSQNLTTLDCLKQACAIASASALSATTGCFLFEDMQRIYQEIIIDKL